MYQKYRKCKKTKKCIFNIFQFLMIFVEFPAIFNHFHDYFATWSNYFATWYLFRASGALPIVNPGSNREIIPYETLTNCRSGMATRHHRAGAWLTRAEELIITINIL